MDGLLQDQQHITPHKPPYKALQRAPTILHYIIITDTKGLSVLVALKSHHSNNKA